MQNQMAALQQMGTPINPVTSLSHLRRTTTKPLTFISVVTGLTNIDVFGSLCSGWGAALLNQLLHEFVLHFGQEALFWVETRHVVRKVIIRVDDVVRQVIKDSLLSALSQLFCLPLLNVQIQMELQCGGNNLLQTHNIYIFMIFISFDEQEEDSCKQFQRCIGVKASVDFIAVCWRSYSVQCPTSLSTTCWCEAPTLWYTILKERRSNIYKYKYKYK